uniref:Secreted protein n=1 Tax=Mesocestoides corti TaxID=53468 RepID=A0A5K3G892_MESCO
CGHREVAELVLWSTSESVGLQPVARVSCYGIANVQVHFVLSYKSSIAYQKSLLVNESSCRNRDGLCLFMVQGSSDCVGAPSLDSPTDTGEVQPRRSTSCKAKWKHVRQTFW